MQEMTPLQKYLLQRKLVGGGVGPEMGMAQAGSMGQNPMQQSEPLPIGPDADPFSGGETDPLNAMNEEQKKKMMAMRPYLGG